MAYNEQYTEEEYGDYEEHQYDDSNAIVECPPSCMDSSIGYFPSTTTMHKSSNMDFGVIIQPTSQSVKDGELPLVSFQNSKVVRCRVCRCYINPFVEWVSSGPHVQWMCNLCGASNQMDNANYYNEYLQGLRQELQYASVEIVAPQEYCVRPPQFPSYLFVINVCKQLIECNVLKNICNTIKQIINDEEQFEDERIQIGFITYSDKIHYYSLKSTLSKPKMIVINDMNDALLPIPSNQIMVNLSESREIVNHLLNILPSLHSSQNCSSENAFGTAIQCAFSALKPKGGKMVCFSFGLPSLGKGKVMNRAQNANVSNVTEYDRLLKRNNNYYMDLAISFTKYQISCDLFQFCRRRHEYCDISTVKGISRCSGGELFYYDAYNDLLHGECFCNDLYKIMTRRQGWESVMRVRVSKGISIEHYYGCFNRRSADLLSLPCIDSDKSVMIILNHNNQSASFEDDDKKQTHSNNQLINAAYIYVQSALLYTNSLGQRRIRCCTKRIPVTSSYDELFESVNLSVMTAMIAKQAVFKMLSKDIATARMFIQDSCISALKSYATYCKQSSSMKNENDYPISLRYWPLNTLALLKCRAFADARDVSKWVFVDQRIALLTNILHINQNNIELLIRPSLYRIDDIMHLDEDTLNDEYYLPSESPLTLKSLSSDGLYLLNNGQSFMLYVGKNADSSIVDTFLQKNFYQNDKQKSASFLSLLSSEHNKYVSKLNEILQYLQSINYRHQSIDIISEAQKERKLEFCTIYLIRDRTESVMSYDEFFGFIYKQTRQQPLSKRTQQRR